MVQGAKGSNCGRVVTGVFNGGVFNGGVFCCFKPWKVCFLWAPFVGVISLRNIMW